MSARSNIAPTFVRTLARRPGFLRRLVDALALGRQRSHLASLDDHMLADIGIDRSSAEAEARRPIWDAPQHWQE